ncbi:MAG: putative ATP-grasp superfamily ATP-dependent carboligase, partial [Candidatus Azotimanducaceae bacterium]
MSDKYVVLILDSQAETSIPFAQELGKIDTVVHAAAKYECLAFKSKYVSKAMVYPVVNSNNEFISWLKSLDRTYHYDLIIPLTENMLEVFQHLDEDDLLRKKSFLASRKNLAVALDKMKTSLLALSLGIPVPNSVLLDESKSIDQPNSYPVVLKTLQSYIEIDGKNVYSPVCIASDLEERDRFIAKWLAYSPVQQQAYFHGEGWGVEFLYVGGVRVLHFCHQRIHELPLTGGASSYRRSVDAPKAMLDAGTAILDQLNWHGLAMVEFKMNEKGEFVLLEINPRPWGSLPLSVKAGVNFPVEMLRVAVGKNLAKQPRYQTNYYLRNFARDLDWTKENLLADSRDELLLTRNTFISI